MGRNSSGLHLKIAEWILERREAVSVYDVSENFGLTINQARAFMTVLERDGAIKTHRGTNVPSHASSEYGIRTLKVTAIDREKIEQRTKNPDYGNYKNHPVRSVGDLPLAEKWEWVTSSSKRRKK